MEYIISRKKFLISRRISFRTCREDSAEYAVYLLFGFANCSNLFTQTGLGELFSLRNAGNIVPLYATTGGRRATIEYAVSVLGVKHVIICGHSGCGAIEPPAPGIGQGNDTSPPG